MRWHRTVRTIGIGAATLLTTVAVTAASAAASSPAPPYPTHYYGKPGTGCPSGALCIYKSSDDFAGGPEKGGVLFSYGAHNLHGQYGRHLVYNNQYPVGGYYTGATFCEGDNGKGLDYVELDERGQWSSIWLTPVNSVVLWDVYDFSHSQCSYE